MAALKTKYRERKAYRLANKIVFSYLWLYAKKWLFGQAYFDKRIEQLNLKNAQRIKNAIIELKGLFTKIGQLLSVMSNILPEAYATVLESLQDNAPASSFESTQKTIRTELGEDLSTIFNEFDHKPLASASIGQVYRARLKTGEVVAVKIQHPDIEQLAQVDLTIIQNLIRRISFVLKIKGIDYVYQQVRQMIEAELDYQKEAESMIRISDNIEEFERIIVPKVYTAYSSSKILVTNFHHGVKITQLEKLKEWNINTQELAEQLITVFCKMVLVDGFYHADPHPGNVLVNKEGKIILLDFGATAELNDAMRKEIPIIIQHIIRKDTPNIIRSLQKMGFLGNDYESQEVAEKLVDALTTFVQNEIKIDNLNIKDVKFDDIKGSSVDRLRKEIGIRNLTHTIQVPKDWILLDRTMILIHGISASIAPNYNPLETIKPYLKKIVLSDGGLKNLILDTIKQEFSALIQLPSSLNTFLDKANTGKLVVETRNKDLKRLYALGHQMMLFIAMIVLLILFESPHFLWLDFWFFPLFIALGIFLFLSVRRQKRKM